MLEEYVDQEGKYMFHYHKVDGKFLFTNVTWFEGDFVSFINVQDLVEIWNVPKFKEKTIAFIEEQHYEYSLESALWNS